MFYCKKLSDILNINANITKLIDLKNRYFNSLIKLRYLLELTNIEIKAYPNEILSIQNSDLEIIIVISLIFKDMIISKSKNIININNNDFNKIPNIMLIG